MVELDANFLVAVLRNHLPATRLIQRWLRRNEAVAISSIAWSEFLCGPLLHEEKAHAALLVTRIEPFDTEDAAVAADLFNATGRRSRSHVDCMIAAHAIRRSAALATLNLADFRRFTKFDLTLANR